MVKMGALGKVTTDNMGEQPQSQSPTGVQNTTTPATSHSAGPSLAMLIGLPALVIIFTVIVVLMLVLAWHSLRRRWQDGQYKYRSLPTEDKADINSEGGGRSGRPLPYPPAVKLTDPPIPTMTYHMATELSDPTTTGSRYPFIQHQQTKRSVYETRPGRLRTRRRGNHKHGRGVHTILNNAEPDPEVLKERLEQDKRRGGEHDHTLSSSIFSLGQQQYNPHIMDNRARGSDARIYRVPPDKKSSLAGSAVEKAHQDPIVFLMLLYNKDTASLVVRIDRVVGLPFREDGSEVNAYVRLFFIPQSPALPQRRTSKTKARRTSAPVFDEEIRYEAMSAEEVINSTLHIEVLDYRSYGKHSILGQADLLLAQVQFEKGEAAVTLSLHPPKVRENRGTVLLSLSYSPESKKLSVILLRAKELNEGNAKDTDCQAKICVTMGDKVMGKLRTKRKYQSSSPIFNEALTCCIDPNQARNIMVNVLVFNDSKQATKKELGQVTLCAQSSGEEYRHWNDVLATPGKHIAEWHGLR